MALQKQVIDLSIVGGIDEKTDPRLTTQLIDMLNLRYSKTGALYKRNGTTRIGNFNLPATTSGGPAAMPQGDLLTPYGDRLLRLGASSVHEYAATTPTTDYNYKGYTSGVTLDQLRLFAPQGSYGVLNTQIAIGVSGSLRHLVAVGYDGTYFRTTIIDLATGAYLYNNYALTYATTITDHGFRVVAIGAKVILTWTDNSGAGGTGTFATAYNTATGTWDGSKTTLTASSTDNNNFDAVAWDVAFAVAFSAGNDLIVKTYDASLASIATATIARGGASTAVAVHYRTGDSRLYAASVSGGNIVVYVRNAATLAAVANTGAIASGGTTNQLAFGPMTTTRYAVFWNNAAGGGATKWCYVDTSGANSATATLLRGTIASKPFATDDGRLVMALAYGNTVFLVEPDTADPGGTNKASILGTIAPRQISVSGVGTTGYQHQLSVNSFFNMLANAATDAATARVYFPFGIRATQIANAVTFATIDLPDVLACVVKSTKQTTEPKPTATEAAGLCLVASGTPHYVDSAGSAELGFATVPSTPVATLAAGGSLTVGTYSYVVTFEQQDGSGNIHRSSPSLGATMSAATSGGNLSYSVAIPTLCLTNNNASSRPVVINVYRTTANGTTYYFLTSLTNSFAATTVTLVDITADGSITGNRTLYTTGGVLPNVCPSSAKYVAYFQNCVVLAGTPDDLMWFSKPVVLGECPEFADEITQPPFAGGKVTGLGVIDDKLIIFKQSGVYVISGTPPNDLGDSSLSAPQVVASDVGCTEPRSIVTMQDGLMFQAPNGRLYIVTRSLQVMPIGDKVENETVTSGAAAPITSANVVPYNRTVRFTRAPASSARTATNALDYDYYHGSVQQPVWGRSCYLSTGASAQTPVSACMYQGQWVYLTLDGYIWREDLSGQYKDVAGGSAAFVRWAWQGAWVKPRGTQGYGRVWRISALGEAITDSTLTLTIYANYSTATSQSATFQYAAPTAVIENQIHLGASFQKAESFSFLVEEVGPPSGNGTCEGIHFTGLSMVVGVKEGQHKVPVAQKG